MHRACALIRAFANIVKFPASLYAGVDMGGTIEAVTGDATELVGSEVGGYLGILQPPPLSSSDEYLDHLRE